MPAGIILKTGQAFDVIESLYEIERSIADLEGTPGPLRLKLVDAEECLIFPDQIAAVFARRPRI